MKTLEQYASIYSRKSIFHKVSAIAESLDEMEVDYLISELQDIQAGHENYDLVLRAVDEDDERGYFVVGYYELEPIEQFESRIKTSYENYVYIETQQIKKQLPPAERKALEIKELEERLAQLKETAE